MEYVEDVREPLPRRIPAARPDSAAQFDAPLRADPQFPTGPGQFLDSFRRRSPR